MSYVPCPVAIDGPVASGKTSVGRLLSQRLGYRFLDTGSMYRAVTWLALERGIDLEHKRRLSDLAESAQIEVVPGPGSGDRLLVDGRDITDRLREPQVGEGVSLVASVKGVREALVRRQRLLAREGRIVVAGRDIGTVVLPDAPLKVFLVASPEERGRRRYRELKGLGKEADYAQVVRELAMRDRIDSERSHSPLRPAQDARLIDTEGLSVQQVVERIISMMEKG